MVPAAEAGEEIPAEVRPAAERKHAGINGGQITVKAGEAFTLSVQVDGNELKFLSLRDGDLCQAVSAATGDNDDPLLCFLLSMLSAGAVSGSILYRRRKQYAG